MEQKKAGRFGVSLHRSCQDPGRFVLPVLVRISGQGETKTETRTGIMSDRVQAHEDHVAPGSVNQVNRQILHAAPTCFGRWARRPDEIHLGYMAGEWLHLVSTAGINDNWQLREW